MIMLGFVVAPVADAEKRCSEPRTDGSFPSIQLVVASRFMGCPAARSGALTMQRRISSLVARGELANGLPTTVPVRGVRFDCQWRRPVMTRIATCRHDRHWFRVTYGS